MGWITRMFRLCIPLGRQERLAPIEEGSIRSAVRSVNNNLIQQSLGRQERLAPIEGTVRSANNLVLPWTLSDLGIDIDEILREFDERFGVHKSVLSEETISASLETKIIHIESSTSEDRNEETEICTICQAEYESGEKVATLNCDHEYHVECIKQWLRGKNACPICKSPDANTQPQVPSCAMIDIL